MFTNKYADLAKYMYVYEKPLGTIFSRNGVEIAGVIEGESEIWFDAL